MVSRARHNGRSPRPSASGRRSPPRPGSATPTRVATATPTAPSSSRSRSCRAGPRPSPTTPPSASNRVGRPPLRTWDRERRTEAGHARHPAKRRRCRRQRPGLFLRKVVAHALAEAEHLVVFNHPVKTELRAHLLKEIVVRMRQGFRQAYVTPGTYANHGVPGNHAFLQSRNRDEWLDCGTRLEARGKRHLLVHHGKNATARGINSHHRTFFMTQRVERYFPNDRIIRGGVIARPGVRIFDVSRPAHVSRGVMNAARLLGRRSGAYRTRGPKRIGRAKNKEKARGQFHGWICFHINGRLAWDSPPTARTATKCKKRRPVHATEL